MATVAVLPIGKWGERGYDMALGLSRHTKTNDPYFLRKFAEKTNSKTYGDIYGTWFPDADKIIDGMRGANKIHFNLDQFDMNRYKKFLRNPIYDDAGENITNWELYNVLNNSELSRKTIFYGKGGKVGK